MLYRSIIFCPHGLRILTIDTDLININYGICDKGPNLLSKLMIILFVTTQNCAWWMSILILHAIEAYCFYLWFDVLVDKKLVHHRKACNIIWQSTNNSSIWSKSLFNIFYNIITQIYFFSCGFGKHWRTLLCDGIL